MSEPTPKMLEEMEKNISEPVYFNGPVWILECQHLTITPDDSCPVCAGEDAARAEARGDAVKKIKGKWFKAASSSAVVPR